MSEILNENQSKNKRQRGKNFNEREKELLIDLIFPIKSIIENVKVSKMFFIIFLLIYIY